MLNNLPRPVRLGCIFAVLGSLSAYWVVVLLMIWSVGDGDDVGLLGLAPLVCGILVGYLGLLIGMIVGYVLTPPRSSSERERTVEPIEFSWRRLFFMIALVAAGFAGLGVLIIILS